MRLPAVRALLLALLVTACGDAEDAGGGVAMSRPTGSDQVVVQVMVTGGFVPVEMAVSAVPTVTVLGDGTVITTAPVTAIYPGPAIIPLQSVRVPAQTVDDLVAEAADLGLLGGPLDFGQPPVADAPDTIVTVTANGTEHRHVANALGMEERIGAGGGISDQAAANRRALRAFVEATSALPPGQARWQPPAVAVYVLGDYVPEPGLPQPERDMLDGAADATGRLVAAGGYDVVALAVATGLSVFKPGGRFRRSG
ncbi:MAG: hypothetical protein ACRD1D_13015, partial [Acidimicrobiales bacterium]